MNIRNFVIISHVDHGKSTLADRFLEITGTVPKRQMKEQYLDRLESERERGITIKMAPVRMVYKDYILNLIDTPGHSDFAYEVSRALAAVEGAILLVDAVQGIQAQTLANFQAAKEAGLKIIGAVSKIDLNPDNLENVIETLADLIEVKPEEVLKISGKTGEGVEMLLEKVISEIPAPRLAARQAEDKTGDFPALPRGRPASPQSGGSRALIFDSLYDQHKGIVAFVRVFDGVFKNNDKISFIASKTSSKIKEVGYFRPDFKPSESIKNGEIGYIVTGVKDPDKIKIGDTISINSDKSLAGYKEPQLVVFVSFYPEDSNDFEDLKKALSKLQLNDSSLIFEPDTSELLGRGFKSGFLGQLHFEITAERLEKEFKIKTIHSFPSVSYRVKTAQGIKEIASPKEFPSDYIEVQEPITKIEIIIPPEYLGGVLSLKKIFRISNLETENIGDRVLITAKLPLADLISDFDDKLKSLSEGYSSLSYKLIGYEKGDLKKLEIFIAGDLASGLTRILPKEKINHEARVTVKKLKNLLPRQQFIQAIQAAVDGQIIARETITAIRKDVTGYLYGGDITRKMKLWKKQKKGKARLQERSAKIQIQIPASIFKELLKK